MVARLPQHDGDELNKLNPSFEGKKRIGVPCPWSQGAAGPALLFVDDRLRVSQALFCETAFLLAGGRFLRERMRVDPDQELHPGQRNPE